MDILKIFTDLSDNQKVISKLNDSVDGDLGKVRQAVQLGLPLLMEALNRNTRTSQGANSLFKALEDIRKIKLRSL